MAAAKTTLDAFLDFLDYSSDNEKQDRTLETPHIDRVLQQYNGGTKKKPSRSTEGKVGVAETSPSPSNNYGNRLVALESQIKELMQDKTKEARKSLGKTIIIGGKKASSEESDSSSDQENRVRNNVKIRKRPSRQNVSSIADDKKAKNQLQTSGVARHTHCHTREPLTHKREVEEERERRWKSEQASVKLAEHVRRLQLQSEDWQKKFEVSVTKRNQLESALINEKEKASQLSIEIKRLKTLQEDEMADAKRLQRRCEDQSKRLFDYEEQVERLERARSQLFTDTSESLREAETRAAASEREVSLQQQAIKKLELQLQQLQDLLATREREHQKDLERLQPLESHSVQELIQRELERERMRSETIALQLKEKLQTQQKAYRDLEEEFRAGLRIEAARYQQLETDHVKLAEDLALCQDQLESTRGKENQATSLISELSSIVKEQKVRISDLLSSRQELNKQLDNKTKQLDTETIARAKYEERVQILQEENTNLLARLSAQDSLLVGLREEKKLWSQELANQGAALAQDRGRYESKIESLQIQVSELQELAQNNKTTIRVREKVIEDQTSTIKSLKEEAQDLKRQLSTNQSDLLDKIDELNGQIEEERSRREESQEQLGVETEQKIYIEEQLHESQNSTKKWKDKYSKLKGQWEERIGLISALEESVQQLQERSRQREEKLMNERDTAIGESREASERLLLMKAELQEQSQSQKKMVEERVAVLLKEKDREIDAANRKVAMAEEEMKQVLAESVRERKAMEAKFQRLSKAFQDMQKELS
ncbi:PREDICTED: leucine-rich repeat and coiled-coil domain-containing protein 1-like [Amphimedon queenslandica]|uniref:Uncharacterized protein n=1 Tax=Amphimedon queenslandica TaxID=400682 RepID=A0A1X7VVU0_AMPQE|nr:PREDICTED: leucine-rich repeat and coiled-coil domain-containing protein 1-like [Amphimedon queenslandica]|eukprot:XP_011402544.1 PREDICTED: leucine-rich repeat and coiled-coil domain-containing protein 1-like [Amphimedon queenslandica]